jgi:hypothetical protein
MSRLVFVPLFGDGHTGSADGWKRLAHVKAWGLYPVHGEFVPLHSDPPLANITLGHPQDLFEPELNAMTDVVEGDTTVPDQVYAALAARVLQPVRED